MSEYQYYEFLAIDRPLTEDKIAELRSLSTRATITPVSFSNEYNWGDFHADPEKLMHWYFDAHVYVANWMTAIFMVSLPSEALTKETAEAISVPYVMDIEDARTHWIITWSLEDMENYDRFGVEDGRGWMVRLAPVRDELLRGDLRSLYIGWLAAVTQKRVDGDKIEPLAVNGLQNLTTAQQALSKFLEVDPDLLSGAGIGSMAARSDDISEKEVDFWIEGLPRDELNLIVKHLIEGKGQLAERSVKNRFASWRASQQKEETEFPRRKVKELWQNAEEARQIRLKNEERERKLLELKRIEERQAYLKNLSRDFTRAWKSVQESVKRGSGLGYDEACHALVDIYEAYALFESREKFKTELKVFMADHMRRKALIQRLVKAGIWKEQKR